MNTLTNKLLAILLLFSLSMAQAQKPTKKLIKQTVDKTPSFLRFLFRGGMPYYKHLVNPVNQAEDYKTPYKKALNLGLRSIDMAYANKYEQSEEAIACLQVVKALADDLNIGQFFDFNTIKKLAATSNSLELLVAETDTIVSRINHHLYDVAKRPHLFILMLTGSWLESSYIISSIAAKMQYSSLLDKYAKQQHESLKQLLLLLSYYKKANSVKKIYDQLDRLSVKYKGINGVMTEDGLKQVLSILTQIRTHITTKE